MDPYRSKKHLDLEMVWFWVSGMLFLDLLVSFRGLARPSTMSRMAKPFRISKQRVARAWKIW